MKSQIQKLKNLKIFKIQNKKSFAVNLPPYYGYRTGKFFKIFFLHLTSKFGPRFREIYLKDCGGFIPIRIQNGKNNLYGRVLPQESQPSSECPHRAGRLLIAAIPVQSHRFKTLRMKKE
jgi:hypothetical protein